MCKITSQKHTSMYEKWTSFKKEKEISRNKSEEIEEKQLDVKVVEKEKIFESKRKDLLEKVKNVINILKPHSFEEALYKVAGVIVTASGVDISRIAFFNPEQINVLNRPLTSGEDLAVKMLGLWGILMGGVIFTEGIREAIENIKKKKEKSEGKM